MIVVALLVGMAALLYVFIGSGFAFIAAHDPKFAEASRADQVIGLVLVTVAWPKMLRDTAR